jgi:hypothetical protein
MSANGTTPNEKLPKEEKPQSKPPKKRTKPEKEVIHDDSDKDSDSSMLAGDGLAITKWKNLKAGRYYHVVSLGSNRQRNRIVAVPVSDIEVYNRQLMKNV